MTKATTGEKVTFLTHLQNIGALTNVQYYVSRSGDVKIIYNDSHMFYEDFIGLRFVKNVIAKYCGT